jgi:hypothetical protein
MRSTFRQPSSTTARLDDLAVLRRAGAASILLLLCLLAGTINAQQPTPAPPQQTHIVFELSADDLSEWGQSRVATIEIEVKNPNLSSQGARKIVLLANRGHEIKGEPVVVAERDQAYSLTQYLKTPFALYTIMHDYEPSARDPLLLRIEEVSWPNDTGTIIFKQNNKNRISAFINLSLEPAKYDINCKVNDGRSTIQLVNLVEDLGENRTRPIQLTAPTLFGSLWNKLVSTEGLLWTIIVALATILVGVLKEKIKAVFNWTLDFLGKYVGGKLAERRFLKRYIDHLSFNHKYLKLIGFNTAGISRPLLEEVFVSLRIAGNSLPGGGTNNHHEGQSTSTISFNSAFRQYKYMVILGGPGAGKTTTLSYALLMFAQQRGAEKFGIKENLVPVYIPLRRLSNTNRSIIEDLTDKDTQILSAEVIKECPSNYFERKLKKGKCLVLLDGLDEVTDEKTHRQVAERINSLVAAYPGNRFVVTCRIAGWKDLLSGEFKVLLAQNFNRDEIQRFILGWHRAVITQSEYSSLQLNIPDKEKFEEDWETRKEQFVKPAIDIQSRRLIYAIDTNTRILAIAVNPMLLSLISLVHYNRQYLPKGRTVLYSHCVDLLIDSWERSKDILSTSTKVTAIQKEAVLREIAFNFQVNGKGEDSRDKLEGLIAEITQKLGISMPPQELLHDIETRSGLLTERSIDVFGFSHLTLQEYLVARHIHLNHNHYGLLTANFDRQEWREVILLYTGLVDDATELIEGVAASPSLERQILAGYCIGDAQHCDSAVSEGIVNHLLEQLSENGERSDDLINALSAIAADFSDKAVSVEERLSERLIGTIGDETAREEARLHAITILGRARVTRALPSLINSTINLDEAVKEESIKAVIQFGNLALPTLERHGWAEDWPRDSYYELVAFFEKRPETAPNANDLATTAYAEAMIEVLAGINTGQSARLLMRLYGYWNPWIDSQVSIRLAQMMTNAFVEADLLEVETAQLPKSIRDSRIDRNGWSYKSARSGFWHIDTKLRSDVMHVIGQASTFSPPVTSKQLTPLRTVSFKILFPALLSYLRNLPPNYINPYGSSKYKINTFRDLGFDDTEHNKLHYLVTQINKSFAIPLDLALQNIGDRKTSDYAYKETLGVNLIVVLSNMVFTVFYAFTLLVVYFGLIFLIEGLSSEEPVRVHLIDIFMITSPFFYLCLILITRHRLKKGFLTRKFFALMLLPIANFMKVLPYLTRRRPWVKLILFQLLTLFFSASGLFTSALIYELFTEDKPFDYPLEQYAFFYVPGLLFLILSTLYWKYYILAQNPVLQLMLLHPEGRKLANEG